MSHTTPPARPSRPGRASPSGDIATSAKCHVQNIHQDGAGRLAHRLIGISQYDFPAIFEVTDQMEAEACGPHRTANSQERGEPKGSSDPCGRSRRGSFLIKWLREKGQIAPSPVDFPANQGAIPR
jgi:hypothetical protein